MTQEQCERAVKALKIQGFNASHMMGRPNDHGVWIDMVWNDSMGDANSFRLHDEEIEWWGMFLDTENKNNKLGS